MIGFSSLFLPCPATDRHRSFRWKSRILEAHTSSKQSIPPPNQPVSKFLSCYSPPYFPYNIRHLSSYIKIPGYLTKRVRSELSVPFTHFPACRLPLTPRRPSLLASQSLSGCSQIEKNIVFKIILFNFLLMLLDVISNKTGKFETDKVYQARDGNRASGK